jgi:dTDP-4-amino-4,6-dideoxygalactose transaminase
MDRITFNKPYFTGNETKYIEDAVKSMKISGDGVYTKKCHDFFEQKYNFKKCLLTTSCTDALEMAAILINTKEGDEIIMPSYTFVSTSNAFVLRGAKIVFADSKSDHPNIDVSKIEALITSKTKAIVPVHYGGLACDMDEIMALAEKYNLFVIEDAAQAIDSYYKGKPLGSIGHLAAFSFHETKNIISGEGGMLVINDDQFIDRAEIIREKGTNRSKFYRGEVDKYGWIDIGSSFLPSDIIAAFLFAQLENLDRIQEKRKQIWNSFHEKLADSRNKGNFKYLEINENQTNNGHLFALILNSLEERTALIDFMRKEEVMPVFHYLSLHKSPYYQDKHDGRALENCDRFADTLLRLPFYHDLTGEEIEKIALLVSHFFELKNRN